MKRLFGLVTGATAWFALITQLVLTIQLSAARGMTVAGSIWRYFAFFTILTNLLVALMFTAATLTPSTRVGRFFDRAESVTGITANIFLVGLVYNTLLFHLNVQEGWRFVTDLLLHFVVPIFTVIYWWLAVRDAHIRWINAIAWVFFLVAYFFYVIVRGVTSGFYPYYFINVAKLGFGAVMLNSLAVLATFFFIIAVLMVAKTYLGAATSRGRAA